VGENGEQRNPILSLLEIEFLKTAFKKQCLCHIKQDQN
jgi:hypothetical protein